MTGHVYKDERRDDKCLLVLTDTPRLLCIDTKTCVAKIDVSCHDIEVVCTFLVWMNLMVDSQ